MKGRVAITATVAAGAVAASLFGGLLRTAPAPAPAAVVSTSAAVQPAGSTAATVQQLQDRLRRDPEDVQGLDLLGLAYQQRARETGDPAYYTKSEGVLRDALALAPRDLLATAGLGSLALSRHRFSLALTLGRRAHAISPSTVRPYAVIGDAQLELGRYRQAFATFDRLAAMRPGLLAYARVAHARELLGQPRAALAAYGLALHAAAGQGEPEAWTRVMMGKLRFANGDVSGALADYRAALSVFPAYPPALDAQALAEWARGDRTRSITLERRAVDAIPLPQYVALLGDLEADAGHGAAAREQYGLIGAIERLLAANGVRTDLETALFRADHRIALGRTVALARLAQRERPSIDGDDVLAWALARDGRCAEALPYARRALRLRTHDPLKRFHLAWIERCAGHPAAARTWARRALALNPRFSVRWAAAARRLA